MNRAAPAIGDYGIIGDCQSAALVSRDGALDWLCWPRFDSPAIFAGILDLERGGRWIISPRIDCPSSRRYIPETNVLETRFENSNGTVTLTDFMPLADEAHTDRHLTPDHAIIRLLRCEDGSMQFLIRFSPRPNFGKDDVRIIDRGKLGLRAAAHHGVLSLHSNLRFEINDGTAEAILSLKAGDEFPLILTYSESSPEVIPLLNAAGQALNRTTQWWRKWVSSNCYSGPYRYAVTRSVLTLKLLEFPTSGAFVAAPTTSLPERIGGNLNWDYRYCWLRDASFVIEALCGTDFVTEAEAFVKWLLHATRSTQPKLMVLYDVYGNLAPRETTLPHLRGHRGSSPVNVGNGARTQSQLDIYGHVISGVATLLKKKRTPADGETARVLIKLGHHVCEHWRDADDGIWEVRDKPAIHTHARLACWLALDELITLHEARLLTGVPVDEFSRARDAIRKSIETESWDAGAATYTAEPGKPDVDASLFCLAIAGFTDASSARMQGTNRRLFARLNAGNSLIYRNLPPDGVPIEGAFGICGFWRVQFLAMGGASLAEAEKAFGDLTKTANDLGLLGEETDPTTGAVLGNFPQAFTHIGLINAALAIEERRQLEEES